MKVHLINFGLIKAIKGKVIIKYEKEGNNTKVEIEKLQNELASLRDYIKSNLKIFFDYNSKSIIKNENNLKTVKDNIKIETILKENNNNINNNKSNQTIQENIEKNHNYNIKTMESQ